MKYLILGCNGMAGHMIGIYLKEQGHEVVGFARRKLGYMKTVEGDIREKDKLISVITEGHFDYIVNCIGILTGEAERKKAEAVYINGYLPHMLADITEKRNTHVIHMSTDCVFSGTKGNYCEEALRDATTFYGRSKALGELDDGKNITIRSSIVGPDINENGVGLLNWFMKQKGKVCGYTNVFWTGQTTLQYAKTVEAASRIHATGIYNLVPEKKISKYELLILFNKFLCQGRIMIKPYDGIISDKSLKRTRYDFGYGLPDYETMVSELAEWMLEHKEIYPHYQF